MLGFPKSTEFGRVIAKEKFYQNMNVNTTVQSLFVKDVEKIIWQNKLSEKSINIAKGDTVIEIDVLEIRQKNSTISNRLIEFIDNNTPRHNIFVLTYENKGQICISFKEKIDKIAGKFKVKTFYRTEYFPVDTLKLSINGLTLDKVYENFIGQVAGDKLKIGENSLEEAVNKSLEREKLEQQITVLKIRIKKEKQFNIVVRLNGELRKLKERLNDYETTGR